MHRARGYTHTMTSDLAYGWSPEQIAENLEKTWNVALAHKSKVLALTIPEAGVKGAVKERLDAKRNAINKILRNFRRPN
jgi:hypothetical protein